MWNRIAYGMDHSRMPLVQIRASPERDVAPSTVNLRVSTDSVPEVKLIAWDYEGDGRFDAGGQTSILRPSHSHMPATMPLV